MRALALALASVAALLPIAAPDASASSFHEQVEAKPINKGGEVVGFRITLRLRPDGTQKTVKIGLGISTGSGVTSSGYQEFAVDPKKGYLKFQWPDIAIPDNKPQEITLPDVLFKDVPDLTPGADIEIVTAWIGSSRTHVWGMKRPGVSGTIVKLPEAKKPEVVPAKPASTTAARARFARRLQPKRPARVKRAKRAARAARRARR